MDHQIQHDGDIVGPVGVGAVATPLQNHHLLIGHHLGELSEGWIEALDVADLKQATSPVGGVNQRSRFILTRGDRLLDQDMQTCIKTLHSHLVVKQRRHSNTDRLHLFEHRPIVGKPVAAELFTGQTTTLLIQIGHANQISILEQAEHTSVVPAHVADPDHPDLDWNHGVGGHQITMVVEGKIKGDQSWGSSATGSMRRTRSMRGPCMAVISNWRPLNRKASPGEGMCWRRSSRKPARV